MIDVIRTVDELYTELIHLLDKAGFTKDLYEIHKYDECVGIFFEKKEAVEYFKGDFEYSILSEDCVFEYKEVRNKHVAYIYSW